MPEIFHAFNPPERIWSKLASSFVSTTLAVVIDVLAVLCHAWGLRTHRRDKRFALEECLRGCAQADGKQDNVRAADLGDLRMARVRVSGCDRRGSRVDMLGINVRRSGDQGSTLRLLEVDSRSEKETKETNHRKMGPEKSRNRSCVDSANDDTKKEQRGG